jgi:predicted phosphodiesterase
MAIASVALGVERGLRDQGWVRIAIMTDTHLAPGGRCVLPNCRAVRDWVGRSGAELTLHLGDVTAEGAVKPEHFPAAVEALADWPTPLHVLPGNHDIGDNHDPARSSAEPPVDEVRLARHRAAFGPDRWRLERAGWTLIGLNAMLFGWDAEEARAQDDWLEGVVAEARGPIAVFLHKPLFRTAPEDDERHLRYVPREPRRRLLARLAASDLRLVLSGHTHQLRRHRHSGVDHVWAPSSAFRIPDELQERVGQKPVGVMLLTLDGDRHSLDFVAPQGVIRHSLLDQADIYPQLLTPGWRHS